MIQKLLEIKNNTVINSPLVHCITNPISINDCANAVLAVGGKPIMAEHPKEVADITSIAKALAVNLGNITDVRMEAISISVSVANSKNIPVIIDLVGVACSTLRKEFALELMSEYNFSVIKGNITEIKAVCINHFSNSGVDELSEDKVTEENLSENIALLKAFSRKTNSVVLATGWVDLIAYKDKCYSIYNGTQMLSKITGTGCMLNVLTASFLSENSIVEATILATALLGISGELASQNRGNGTFRLELLNKLSNITEEEIINRIKIEEV